MSQEHGLFFFLLQYLRGFLLDSSCRNFVIITLISHIDTNTIGCGTIKVSSFLSSLSSQFFYLKIWDTGICFMPVIQSRLSGFSRIIIKMTLLISARISLLRLGFVRILLYFSYSFKVGFSLWKVVKQYTKHWEYPSSL